MRRAGRCEDRDASAAAMCELEVSAEVTVETDRLGVMLAVCFTLSLVWSFTVSCW